MESKMLGELKKKFEDPEYVKELRDKLEFERNLKERNVDRIKKYHGDNINPFIDKVLNKYNSDKYRDREYRMGREPNETLLFLLYEYGETYGENIENGVRVGSYILEMVCGQGCFIDITLDIQKDRDNKIDDILGN